ncbi:hypothetical protein P5V15_009267 [Pogonomyrmex californicus]
MISKCQKKESIRGKKHQCDGDVLNVDVWCGHVMAERVFNEERETNSPKNADNLPRQTMSISTSMSESNNDVAKEKLAIEERLAAKMFSYEIICFFFAITFTALAALHSSPSKLSKPPIAKPFFDQNSVILDFYKGHLDALIERITQADFSFVMYYAPWDAESQVLRHEFEIVAQFYHPQAVIVGYFNFTRLDRTPGYREFYKAAIRSLERDPNRELVFAIVTSASSSELRYGVYKFPSANLLMWNESIIYPESNEWTSGNILNWISSSIHQPSLWLQPPGIKALTLAPYLHEGPVLFLFTPRNPLHIENYIYNLIREISLQYYNCADSMLVKDIIARLEAKRRTAVIRHFSRNEECVDILEKNRIYTERIKESIASISIQQWINNSCCANVAMNKCLLCKTKAMNPFRKEICTTVSKRFDDICKNIDIFTTSITTIGQHEKQTYDDDENYVPLKLQEESKLKKLHANIKYKSSLLKEENDSRSASMVKKVFLKENCKKWLAGNDYHPSLFPQDSPRKFNISLKESVCKTNKTLALIAIDSLHYFHFAEHLGIDISKRKNKTAVVILDAALESQYVMHHDFSEYALVNFINNYTQGLLERTLRSDNSQQYRIQKLYNKNTSNSAYHSKIHVPELTSKTFLNTILDPSKDVVIMYHSPYCGFCSAISYVYLTVAYYLSNMNNLIFVRVNGDNNDLPWEYSMNRFPSILFFPAKRKEDSTVFPFSVSITIPNLLNFVLANLNDDSHIEALINICQMGTGEAPDKCIARTRRLCLDIIEQLLQDYRKLRRHLSFLDKKITRNKRKIILLKLEHIKDIHFILGSIVNLNKDRKKVQLIKRKFSKYYNMIRLLELSEKMEKQNYEFQGATHTSTINRERIRSEL